MQTAIDLFAGAGGATQGLTDAGFSVLAAVENNTDAAAAFKANHPSVFVETRDIAAVSPRGLRHMLNLDIEELTLLTACPPCQGFSTLGPGNRNDERNSLVAQVWRFAREFRPRAVLVENVPGLRFDERWRRLCDNLGKRSRSSARRSAPGYEMSQWIVDAASFGVPQRRRRLIAIAVRRDAMVDLPSDLRDLVPMSFGTDSPDASAVIAGAGDIEGTQDEWHRARTMAPIVLERIRAIPANGSHADLPERLQLACHKRLRRRGKTAATDPYGRIPREGVAPTMTTRCTTVSCGRFVHPTEDRGISLREAALIQTFPPDYRFAGNHGTAERQIGNAVPVKLAHALGLAVHKALGEEHADNA